MILMTLTPLTIHDLDHGLDGLDHDLVHSLDHDLDDLNHELNGLDGFAHCLERLPRL